MASTARQCTAARAVVQSAFAEKVSLDRFGSALTAASPIFRSSKAALRFKLYLAIMAADLLAIAAAFIVASWLRMGQALGGIGLDLLILLLPIYFAISFHDAAYSLEVLQKPSRGVVRSWKAFAIAFAIVIGGLFSLKISADFSRLVVALGAAGALILLGLIRWSLGVYAGRRYYWSFTNEVIIADGVPVLPMRGQIVLFADQARLEPSLTDPVLLNRVGRLLKNSDRVVLATSAGRRVEWAAMLKGIDVNVELLAPELDEMGALGMSRMGDRTTVLVSQGPLSFSNRIIKRVFDLTLTIPVLFISAPLFALVALAIRAESKGPVFFCQERVGQGSRTFRIVKFRSMRMEQADATGARSADRCDDRITKVGAFLRCTSLDELPQLLNVLKGDMSIVGPRPHALGSTAENKLFWEIDDRYWERHVVKPGITGLAQVRGLRGATETRSDLTGRLQADLEYLRDWSLWKDVAITIATLRVLTHRNAF